MKEKFNISGMTCAACVAHVQKAVESLEGTDNVNVNLLTNSMTLDLDTSRTVVADVIDAVERAGYGASAAGNEPTKSRKSNTIRENFDKETKALKYRLIISITFAIPLMYIAMGAMWGLPAAKDMHSNPIAFALTQFLLLLPIMYVNRNYYIKGYKSLINRAPTMDSLIAIGSSAAVVYGVFAIYMIGYGLVDNRDDIVDRYAMNLYFESAAMILTLITVGKYLETRSRSKTGEAL
ncbi:MAG: heavy metal translocating P-type ATPase, partial [Bacteroidetes bacterium]